MSKRLASAAELEQRLAALQDEAWDSDEEATQDTGDASAVETIELPSSSAPKRRKTGRRSKNGDAPSNVLYIGHIPHGFYEDQMRGFFSQFGDVEKLRLSRSKKTGGSKGYAFVEFKDVNVAKIVADSMDKYLLAGKQLEVKQIPYARVHERMWKGAGQRFRVHPRRENERDRHNKERSTEDKKKVHSNLLRGEGRRRKRLAELGVSYDFPGYQAHHQSQVLDMKKASSATHQDTGVGTGRGRSSEAASEAQASALRETKGKAETGRRPSTKSKGKVGGKAAVATKEEDRGQRKQGKTKKSSTQKSS